MTRQTGINIAMGMVATFLVSCGGGQPAAPSSTEAVPHAADHPAALVVPEAYAAKTNPLTNDVATLNAGKKIFTTNCATCHGDLGRGDGPTAAALAEPKPRNLSDKTYVSTLSDGHMLWRISEGGASGPQGSAMPPWKDTLKEDEIWKVIVYVRSLGQ